jgi:intergrase/recombinase
VGRYLGKVMVAGPNPAEGSKSNQISLNPSTFTSMHLLPFTSRFEEWVKAKYSISYGRVTLCYVKKYHHLIEPNSNLAELELLSNDVRSSVVKSLLLLAKFIGCYGQFKDRLKEHGIKLYRPNALDAFIRMLSVSESNIIEYYQEIIPLLRDNERLFVKFLLYSGLRVSEGIESFNLIIELSKSGKLSDYYNSDWSCLMHFKYQKQFIRGTKNAFLTFLPQEFIEQITQSEPLTYSSIRKRLQRNKKPMRLDEFRDFFGTNLINNGILEAEQNLVCGRIPISIFIRHYWSPKLREMGKGLLWQSALP